MFNKNSEALCDVCKKEFTSIHAEVTLGQHLFVCEKCLETAKRNFIWICMQCGKAYIRSKELVLKRISDPAVKQAYLQVENMQIIQGIDSCIECDAESVMEYMAGVKTTARGRGNC